MFTSMTAHRFPPAGGQPRAPLRIFSSRMSLANCLETAYIGPFTDIDKITASENREGFQSAE